jgi:hypothetical protein
MKKILTSSITDSAQLPLLKRTIDHLQEQEIENIKSCVFAQLGSSTETLPIILWGCVGTLSTVTVSNDTLTITSGAMMYLNEIYQVDAQSITKTGANVFALSLDTTTFQAGEPTLYSDGVTSVNTNQIAKIKLVQVLTGAGICDWDNVGIKFRKEDVSFSGPVGSFILRFIRHGDVVTCKSVGTSDTGPGTLSSSIPTWARPSQDFGFKTHFPYATGSFLDQDSVVFKTNGTIVLGQNISSGHDIMISYMV